MREIIILIIIIAIFTYCYFGIKRFSSFLLENRRNRKNYEYFYDDEDD